MIILLFSFQGEGFYDSECQRWLTFKKKEEREKAGWEFFFKKKGFGGRGVDKKKYFR